MIFYKFECNYIIIMTNLYSGEEKCEWRLISTGSGKYHCAACIAVANKRLLAANLNQITPSLLSLCGPNPEYSRQSDFTIANETYHIRIITTRYIHENVINVKLNLPVLWKTPPFLFCLIEIQNNLDSNAILYRNNVKVCNKTLKLNLNRI